jgi:23S rRNA pseudouridine2605 synthase
MSRRNYPDARPARQGGHFAASPGPRAKHAGATQAAPRHGLARVLSKAGVCSRAEAARRVLAGRVGVDGRVVRDPEFPVVPGRQRVTMDGQPLVAAQRLYLALNKPRGLVTSVRDEQGRDTVYRCFEGAGMPWLAPVGRLDKASEGLLFFSNDPEWAARLTDPATGPLKTYRVRTAWLEIVLDEGRNRHIRRLLQVVGFEVLRLVRVAIGPVQLGELAKGQWRMLGEEELERLLAHSGESSANS